MIENNILINKFDSGSGRIRNFLEQKFPVFFERFVYKLAKYGKDRLITHVIAKKVQSYNAENRGPIFKSIEIETINRCNNTCSFCPVNRFQDPRPYARMTDELFKSIIEQLSSMDYRGKIGLYSNNEPLLDKRIYKFNKLAREALPNATLYLYTNGDALTVERFVTLMESLDYMIIDNYNNELVLNKKIATVYAHIKSTPNDYDSRVRILLRRKDEILGNRGGNAANRTDYAKQLRSPCILPFEQFVVRPDGKVSLCCNDTYGDVTLGDLNSEKVLDVWYGRNYQNVRQAVGQSRANHSFCRTCDVTSISCEPIPWFTSR